MAGAVLTGISAAVAGSYRAQPTQPVYTNQTNNGYYSWTSPYDYDPARCGTTSSFPCSYILPAGASPASTHERDLIAAGGVASSSFATYR